MAPSSYFLLSYLVHYEKMPSLLHTGGHRILMQQCWLPYCLDFKQLTLGWSAWHSPREINSFRAGPYPVPWLSGEIVNSYNCHQSACHACWLLAVLLATHTHTHKKSPDCSIYMDKATGSVVADPYALCLRGLRAEWLPPSFGKHIVSWWQVSPAAYSF